ncbi:Flagelliform silk protein [[Actinomadura] parvosata subsp. kistnae]|uniref:Uncharacterized protein n=1 Tax=[Actinomadura] parvosata subsp. kistnae TaxID=1909395 RepID=A0A1V0A5C1_9ACTN|nr:hypothetical protein [Nonomuraea sp. ATCC 55076]AQZ65391.1 hypothetical protein BKM31_31575 [Nonomuraea sp. ATCC 55076]SPL96720.1 Flagelliform silk protein [Actinomadura parvosata subsp. kistnae]
MTTGYWQEPLKEQKTPQIDGTQVLDGDPESSDGVSALIQSTKPDEIVAAGGHYGEIAHMCELSVDALHREAGRIAETLGGEYLQQIFEKIGELQRDLARIAFAAKSVSVPLVWYGDQVLPWFHDNVPRTGEVTFLGLSDLDDWVGDNVMNTDTNAHALARHHLQQLNRFIVNVYDAIPPYVEQRAVAPRGGLGDVSLPQGPGLPGGLTGGPGGLVGDPYAGSGLGSPYGGTPDLGGPTGLDPSIPSAPSAPSTPSDPDVPNLQDPSLQNPSLRDPSLQDPSLSAPSLQNPPSTPSLQNPSLNTPQTPTTNLSGLPQTTLPPTTVPAHPVTGGPGVSPGSASATPFTGNTPGPGNAGAMGPNGMPMGGMYPPGTGAAGQERERERVKLPLVEYDAFASDDLGGESVIA